MKAFCQVPGEALRMTAEAFRKELSRNKRLHDLIHRYAQTMINQLAQSVVCNRAHVVEQRICRWLLMTHDRVGADEFTLTQEFLAQMLGVRRATVTVAAGLLQRAGFISYRRGRIKIVKRKALEEQSCECYEIVRADLDRLLG